MMGIIQLVLADWPVPIIETASVEKEAVHMYIQLYDKYFCFPVRQS